MIRKSICLSTWRNPKSEALIWVEVWIPISERIEQFIEPDKNLLLVWNYFGRVGVQQTLRKIHSRFKETKRNRKVAAIGVGVVIETPSSNEFLAAGDRVIFFAPNHPQEPIYICVNTAFITKYCGQINESPSPFDPVKNCPSDLHSYIGWSPYSEVVPDKLTIGKALNSIAEYLKIPKESVQTAHINSTPYRDHTANTVSNENKPTAVLFGLGNYAKTQIIPNIKRYLSLKRVHEIDPDQLLFFSNKSHIGLDTAPVPRDKTLYDSWFIAGYHHTHADLAITALEQGSYAVVEKPIFTCIDQYQKFIDTVPKNAKSKFFVCFNKRYSELHNWAIKDLAKQNSQSIDMQCIVYEIPLPDLHWYNWPSSGSRLISNGCHWIDYFMFVNDYSKVLDYGVWKPRGGDICVYTRLENNAYFTMSLTDTGSKRLGVRDIIQLRSGASTITMVDSASYESERENRIIRRGKVNPMHAYGNMYRKIAAAIHQGKEGDTLESLRSSQLVLLLEDAAKCG